MLELAGAGYYAQNESNMLVGSASGASSKMLLQNAFGINASLHPDFFKVGIWLGKDWLQDYIGEV